MEKVAAYYERRLECDLNDILENLEKYRKTAWQTTDVSTLMGVEGNARETYYSFFDRISDDDAFALGKRTRRPPDNRMNALIVKRGEISPPSRS